MHFVFLNQFYPPEVLPTGVVLEAVAEELVAQGHVVTVVGGKVAVVSGQDRGGRASLRVPPCAAPEEAPQEQLFGNSDAQSPLRGGGSHPGAGQTAPSVHVVRLWAPGWGKRKSALGKVLSYASYYAGVGGWLLRRRHRADVIVALTSPPYLSLLARMGAWWHGGRHAHWVMDLYPDVMVAHGMLRERSLGHRVLGFLARRGMGGKQAGPVITLGPDMAERVQAYLPDGRNADWVPLWGTAEPLADGREVAALRGRRGWGTDAVVFLYSGNMGLGHRFTEILGAFSKLLTAVPERKIHLAFYGGGKRQGEIKAALEAAALDAGEPKSAGASSTPASATWDNHEEPGTRTTETSISNALPDDGPRPTANFPCSLSGYVPQEELAAHLASGDVHLASLDPAWDGMMVPSKLQGIFAAGRPVLFTGSRTCSIGRWILESGGGWVCAPGDVEAHVQAMREALDPAERAKRGAAAHAFAAQWFDREKNVRMITELLAGGGEGRVDG